MKLQIKLDIIEKHVGKVYDKKLVNDIDDKKATARWKSLSQCQCLQYQEEYNKFLINKRKLKESGGTIISQFERWWKQICYQRRYN